MHSDATTSYVPEDFDGFLLDAIPLRDGVWSLYGIDDDRKIAAWSRPHVERCVERLRESRARVRVSEWALGDVTTRGHVACIAKAALTLATARAELAEWESRARVFEAARLTDPMAPSVSPFTLE